MRRRKWLIALLMPVMLLSGCGLLSTSSSTGGDGSAADGAAGDAESWLVLATGSPTPAPATGFPGATPSPAQSFGFLPLPAATPAPSRTPTCAPGEFQFSRINGAVVVPGSTSARVSWTNVGGSNLVEFRVTAISQDLVVGRQRDVGWVTVPATGCGTMTATLPGLSPKTGYVFSVDVVVTRRSGDGTYAGTVARSGVIRTL